MKLVVTAFVTLDGVVERPGFDEHRTGRNAWALRVQNDEDEVYNRGQAMGADALLLGRRTWQIWAAFPLGPTSLRDVPGTWELFEVGSSDRQVSRPP